MGPRVARPDDRLRAISGRCFASPGEPCRPPLHLGFHPRDALLRVVIGAVRCINVPLSRKSHFCVPLVTITFKTWVFLNFAMERPSRFASLKGSDSQNSRMDAGPMLRRVRLVNPFEIDPGPGHPRPSRRTGRSRSSGRLRIGPPVPRRSATPAVPTTSSATPRRNGATRRRNGSSPIPSTSRRTAIPASTTATWCG